MAMRIFLTVAAYVGPKPVTADDVLALWHDGKDFRVYQGAYTSIRDTLRLRMAGVTDICFVWQKADHTVHHHIMDIS